MSITPNFLAALPHDPGVYRMLDANDVVIYVGKAANLKKRVTSYFKSGIKDAKTASLIQQIQHIEITVTRTENEALLLENSLIKTLRPRYNILMRDDKSYPYLYLSVNHEFPRVEIARFKTRPRISRLFGPYPSAGSVREVLNIIQRVFKIRNCSDSYFARRTRPCLQYQIKRCSAPCTGYISAADYARSVKDVVVLLEGKKSTILTTIKARMDAAVANLDFEEAAHLRDQLKSLREIQERQGVIGAHGDADIIAIHAEPGFACIQRVMIKNGEIIANQPFFPTVPVRNFATDAADLLREVVNSFMVYFYTEAVERIPPLIIINQSFADVAIWEQTLTEMSGKKCRIRHRVRGIRARWLDFAENNLRLALDKQKQEQQRLFERFEALRQFMQLPDPIARMECFDISHTQGNETVASCVVFDNNGPLKSEYRHFNIVGVQKGDDYAAMRQVLMRRLQKLAENNNLPDLLIIDGGKGQLGVAIGVIAELNLPQVALLGIAKGVSRKPGEETLIMPDVTVDGIAMLSEVTLPPDSAALHLLQYIRDEAHRFAINFHRRKRAKSSIASTLESVPGIGKKRRQTLLKHFGGMRELKHASVEEIARVEGIGKEMAELIFSYLH